MVKNAAAAQNQATTSLTAPVRTPISRSRLWPTIKYGNSQDEKGAQGACGQVQAVQPAAPHLLLRRCGFGGRLQISGHQGLAVRPSAFLPIGQHDGAHLFQVTHQLGRWGHDLHAFFGQGFFVPTVLFLADLPAPDFGVGSGLGQRGLGGGIQGVKRFAVDDDGVFGQPSLGVVEILDALIGLGVVSRWSPSSYSFPPPLWPGLRQFGGLDGHGLRANQLGDLAGGGAVGAPFDAAHVGH